jgi:NAD(P)-dependent dehydrogenase (short-subunit alcohol dehydrogenase family)
MMSGLLVGKRALVTGSASGIGAAIVAEFVAQGATVFGVDKNISTHQPSIQFDLTAVEQLPELVAAAEKAIGEVDILVNCAGMAIGESIPDLTWDSYDKTLRVNLHSPVFLMKYLGSKMAQRGYGRIVNITSVHGHFSEEKAMSYDVSKGGLNSATRTAAIEFAPHDVLVNAVAPGFTNTPISANKGSNELESEWFKTVYVKYAKIPQLRAAQPWEQAKHVAWLASSENTYCTGQVLFVDGGMSARF